MWGRQRYRRKIVAVVCFAENEIKKNFSLHIINMMRRNEGR
jgi:hypothetical protein